MMPVLTQIVDGAYAMDGGSVYLQVLASDGTTHHLLLVQHGIPDNATESRRLGRLYLDDRLIDVRSPDEDAIVGFLRIASISPTPQAPVPPMQPRLVIGDDIKTYFDAVAQGPEHALRQLVEQLVAFVGSDEYVRLASSEG